MKLFINVALSILSFIAFSNFCNAFTINNTDSIGYTHQDAYSKVTLFKWDRMSYQLFNQTRKNETYKYFPANQTQPMLMAFEVGQKIRKGGSGGSVNVFFSGNKTTVDHNPEKAYSELALPSRIRYTGNTTLWSVFTIEMDLLSDPKTYQIPLQCRFNMSSSTKIEISLRSNGNILFNGLDAEGKTKSISTKKTFNTSDRFKLQIRLSNKGNFIIYLNDKEWFNQEIDPKYFNGGTVNRLWFEGDTDIYHMSLEEWMPAEFADSQFGLKDQEIDNYNSQVADFFRWIVGNYDGLGFVLENKEPKYKMDIASNSFELKSYEQLAMRREFFPKSANDSNGKWGYRIALYLNGNVRSMDGSVREITFPLVYQFLDPQNTDSDNVTFYTSNFEGYPSTFKYIHKIIGY